MLFAIGLITGLIVGAVGTHVYLDRKFQKAVEGVLDEFNERISDALDE